MKSILSTKKLKPNQRDLLLGQGFSLVDYNAIEIKFLDFKVLNAIENAIFTSQNGVLSFFNKRCQSEPVEDRITLRDLDELSSNEAQSNKGFKVFCVGQKTKALLEENGLKVMKMAKNSKKMGDFLIKNHKNEQFHYFCGEERREELPSMLKVSKINVSEVKTYKTILKPVKFDQKWDGILFFSPSGVESYFMENGTRVQANPKQVRNDRLLLICIGETTANEARKYSENVAVANATSVESVIAKAVKALKNN